jgi:hypothetical protein
VVGLVALAALAVGGCEGPLTRAMGLGRAHLAADTADPAGKFTAEAHQFAYDAEPVTFRLDTQGGTLTYAVFNVEGTDTVVELPKTLGLYELTHRFHAGHQPLDYAVYATAFVVRGRRDWLYDKNEGTWHLHPWPNDPADVVVTPQQSLQITCYRRRIRLAFESPGGAPRALALTLTTASGHKTEVPRRPGPEDPAEGFFATGPAVGGTWEVSYTPTHEEVSRAGTTHVELLVEHHDGSVERIETEVETP